MERVPRRNFRMLEMAKVPRTLIAVVLLGTIDGERNVSEKQSDMKTLIEKMRTNTDKQNRKTEASRNTIRPPWKDGSRTYAGINNRKEKPRRGKRSLMFFRPNC
jgi:hypothetical protein